MKFGLDYIDIEQISLVLTFRYDVFFMVYDTQTIFVISGWNQGLVGMCVGEKRKLKVPSKLGYGKHGFVPSVPGNL